MCCLYYRKNGVLSTPERLLSITGTVAHIDRAVCSAAPEYTGVFGFMLSEKIGMGTLEEEKVEILS